MSAERILARFRRHVDVSDNGCHVWTGAVCSPARPYGAFCPDGSKRVRAHRWLWIQTYGAVPEGLELAHSCHNPRCVNLDHLKPVTHAENMRQMVAAGRSHGRHK